MAQRRPHGFGYVASGLFAAAVVVVAVPAAAHPDVEEGRRLAQRAELERAMAAFDRAEASGALGREDLIALLEGRALVHHARGAVDELDRTLDALAEVAPEHRMGRAMPPDVVRAFERARGRARGRLGIVLTVEASGVRVAVENDRASIVREVRVHHREGAGDWQLARGPGPVVVPRRGALALYAIAIGPGGAPVATRGTERAPERIEPAAGVSEAPAERIEPAPGVSEAPAERIEPAAAERAEPQQVPAPAEVAGTSIVGERDAGGGLATLGDDGSVVGGGPAGGSTAADHDAESTSWWPFVAIGGAAVAIGIAVAAVVLLVPGSETQPSFPRHPL